MWGGGGCNLRHGPVLEKMDVKTKELGAVEGNTVKIKLHFGFTEQWKEISGTERKRKRELNREGHLGADVPVWVTVNHPYPPLGHHLLPPSATP